jgi:hypothetical protein
MSQSYLNLTTSKRKKKKKKKKKKGKLADMSGNNLKIAMMGVQPIIEEESD